MAKERKRRSDTDEIVGRFMKTSIPTKDFQVDHLIQLKILIDNLMNKYKDDEIINISDFAKLSKNMVALTDKIRRQDEGIKINQDIHHSHLRLIDIMDTQADNIKQLKTDEKLITLTEDEKDKEQNN